MVQAVTVKPYLKNVAQVQKGIAIAVPHLVGDAMATAIHRSVPGTGVSFGALRAVSTAQAAEQVHDAALCEDQVRGRPKSHTKGRSHESFGM